MIDKAGWLCDSDGEPLTDASRDRTGGSGWPHGSGRSRCRVKPGRTGPRPV